jgi:hypothetical protein
MGAQVVLHDSSARSDSIAETIADHVSMTHLLRRASEADPLESDQTLSSSGVTHKHDRLHPAEARAINLWKKLKIDGNQMAAVMKLALAAADATRQRTLLHDPVQVREELVSYGSYATRYAKSTPGASCSADVVYATGRRPVSFDGSAKTVGSSGVVSWSWHMESKGSGGVATVSCSLRGQRKTATENFSIG